MSSPLYNTAQRGSRTPAQAGLYQYTTRVDQTKDGIQAGNVIIGRHYVATTSSMTQQPKDSESPSGDGIPDHVEDAGGDGQWNQGVETKINGYKDTSDIKVSGHSGLTVTTWLPNLDGFSEGF